jgi:uncharacterized protein
VVTNIVAFGAFVDIGVHQDGLVHVSQLANRYVRDPNEVVQVGQKVKVTVQAVDLPRNRIALTMRTDGGTRPGAGAAPSEKPRGEARGEARGEKPRSEAPKKPAFVPTKGSVAPNGMRFK